MNIIKAASSLSLLLFSSGCGSAAAAAIPRLAGAEPLANPEQYYAAGTPAMTRLEASDLGIAAGDTGYIYTLRINTTVAVDQSVMDRCVEWMFDSDGKNFTWYGMRIQLPPDASTGSGGYYTDVTRATQELGWMQDYNAGWAKILEYNITTRAAQPTIVINFNDNPFWESYIFDFVDSNGEGVAADGSDYQEFKKELSVNCYGTPATEASRIILTPVLPTLTISLQRVSGPPPPSPSPPSSAANVLLAPIAIVAASLLPVLL